MIMRALGRAAASATFHRALLAVGVGACAAGPAQPADEVGASGLAGVQGEVAPGDRGPAVEAVHAFLKRSGYFPNEELSERFPRFEPVFAEGPEAPFYFGERMAKAVMAFQLRSGLDATGSVDSATLQAMLEPHCDNPENENAGAEAQRKFSLFEQNWEEDIFGFPHDDLITYRVTDYGSFDPQTFRNALVRALNTWNNHIDKRFVSAPSGEAPDIEIRAYARGDAPNGWSDFSDEDTLAWGIKTRIAVNDAKDWTIYDLESVLLHESGHSLGLAHSSITGPGHGTPVMYRGLSPNLPRRSPVTDDILALTTRYHNWSQKPGIVRDIAQGPAGGIWAIGDNNSIWSWNGSSWNWVPGNGASIAVSYNVGPLVTSADHSIWVRWLGQWYALPGEGRDVGASPTSEEVWAVSNTAASGGNYYLQKWDSATWTWLQSDRAAVRVTVDGDGRVWAAQADGTVLRRTTDTGHTGSWETLPGCVTDIEAGSQSVWAIGCEDLGDGNHGVWLWNEQPAAESTSAEFQWLQVPGFAKRIGVNYNNMPLVAQEDGTFFYRISG